MKLSKLHVPSLKELFMKEIQHKILSGELKLGERLPTEREMAQEMKLSRSIINLGINELADMGFLKILPRKGVFVEDYLRNGTLETLKVIMDFNGGRVDTKTFNSLMEYRIEFEGFCAQLAAQNRTCEDLQTLQALYNKIAQEQVSEQLSQLIFEFHHQVFCSTGNNVFPLVYNAFKEINMTFTKLTFSAVPLAHGAQELKPVLDAIAAQNASLTKQLMVELITKRSEQLRKQYLIQ